MTKPPLWLKVDQSGHVIVRWWARWLMRLRARWLQWMMEQDGAEMEQDDGTDDV